MLSSFKPSWVKSAIGIEDKKEDRITIKKLINESHEIAKSKGWWEEERDIPHCLE